MITVGEIHNDLKRKNFESMTRKINLYGSADFFMNYTDFLKRLYSNDPEKRHAFFAAVTINYHLKLEKRLPLVL